MIYLGTNDVFLFQGDSITHGGRGDNPNDLNHVIGHGYQASLTGRMAFENKERTLRIYNRGVSGDTTQKLLDRWQDDTLALCPTVLSLLIGINDSYSIGKGACAVYEKNLHALLDRTIACLPDIKLILCEPFAFERPDYESAQHREDILVKIEECHKCAAVVKECAEEYGAVFVPFGAALEPYVEKCAPGTVIWDGIHPTVLGHEIMYRCWYKTVDESGLLKGKE